MDVSINSPVEYNNKLRIKCHFEKINSMSRHYHKSISVFFLIKGNISFFIDGERQNMNENDILLVNSNSMHEAYSLTNATLAVLEFDPSMVIGKSDLYFDLFSPSKKQSEEKYDKVRMYFAKLVKDLALQESELKVMATFYDFIHFLEMNFSSTRKNINIDQTKFSKRILSIVDFIDKNYKKGLSLKDVAEHEYLSTSYLSAFFDKYFGKSFYEYYNIVRLNGALHQLVTTDDSISDIAIANGFSDSRAFVHVFKEKYGVLPSVYRREQSLSRPKKSLESTKLNNEEISEAINILKKFHEMDKKETPVKMAPKKVFDAGNVDLLARGTIIPNYINEVVNFSSSSVLLMGETQQQLIEMNNKMHFKYACLKNIFSDNLLIYGMDKNGNSTYSFVLIDKIIDFLLSIGIKPFFELSFMPQALAKNQNNYFFNENVVISYPKEMKKWCELIDEFCVHLINRYEYSEVSSWLFSIWHIPQTGNRFAWIENRDKFNAFYNVTYKQVKKNLPNMKIGCSSFAITEAKSSQWLENFLTYAKREKIEISFAPLQYFSEELDNLSNSNQDVVNPIINPDEKCFVDSLDNTIRIFNEYGYTSTKFYMIDFCFCLSQRQLLNDTCFASTFFVMNYLNTIGKLNSFSSYYFIDSSRVSENENRLYYGGSGLINIFGVPKSTYNALLLLSKLDEEILARGNGYCITRKYNIVHIMVCNYLHFSNFLANGEFIISNLARYSSFDLSQKMHFEVVFKNVDSSKCIIKNYIVNCQHGSSYDTFVSMGGVNLKTLEDVNYLKASSIPGLVIKEQNINYEELKFECDLEPFEVRLIEIVL